MKKNYIKPSLQVVMLQQSELIAMSDYQSVSLGLDLDDQGEGNAD